MLTGGRPGPCWRHLHVLGSPRRVRATGPLRLPPRLAPRMAGWSALLLPILCHKARHARARQAAKEGEVQPQTTVGLWSS